MSFWCFSCFSLFNLQGTNRSNKRSLIISGSLLVVKHFFKLFLPANPAYFGLFFHAVIRTTCPSKLGIRKTVAWTVILMCRHYLSSRAVASQVFSAQVSLTAVFGMGTGGPSLQSAPTIQFPKTWPPWTNQQGVCPWKRKSNEGNELSR